MRLSRRVADGCDGAREARLRLLRLVADGCGGAREARGHFWLRVAARFNRRAAHETWRRVSWAADAPGCAFLCYCGTGSLGARRSQGVSWTATPQVTGQDAFFAESTSFGLSRTISCPLSFWLSLAASAIFSKSWSLAFARASRIAWSSSRILLGRVIVSTPRQVPVAYI